MSREVSAEEDGEGAEDGRGPAERALLLAVRADWFALPLAVVRVVLEAPRVTRVPEGPPGLVGVVNVRGEVVPVLDTPTVLGTGRATGSAVVAIVESARGPIGLAGEEVRSVELEDDLGPSDLALAVGRRRVGGLVATVLDADAVAGVLRGGGA